MYGAQRLGVAVLVAFTFMVAAPLSAGILYSQPYDGTGGLFASQNDTTGGNGNFATVYDNFTLSGGGSINTVNWTGGYFNPGPPGTITAWTVSFYTDNIGQPGSLLYSANAAGNGNETGTSNPFSYSLTLTTPFAAGAGTQYWLSVVPDLGFPPQWGWGTATGGDGISYQDYFGSRSQLENDFAFSLEGTIVPEPVSMVLVGSALASLALRRRRSA